MRRFQKLIGIMSTAAWRIAPPGVVCETQTRQAVKVDGLGGYVRHKGAPDSACYYQHYVLDDLEDIFEAV